MTNLLTHLHITVQGKVMYTGIDIYAVYAFLFNDVNNKKDDNKTYSSIIFFAPFLGVRIHIHVYQIISLKVLKYSHSSTVT